MELSLDRTATAAVGIVVGVAATCIGAAFIGNQQAAVASTVATALAVIVALATGHIPWFIARRTDSAKAVVVASAVADEFDRVLKKCDVIIDGLGHAAETNDEATIRTSASRCQIEDITMIDRFLDKFDCFGPHDGQAIANAAAAVLHLQKRLNIVMRADTEEMRQWGLLNYYAEIARHSVRSAETARDFIQKAVPILKRHGALTQMR